MADSKTNDKQETPRTDACFEAAQSLIRKYGTTDGVGPEFESGNAYHLARQLERELADVTDRLAGYERHVAVLEGMQETREEEDLSATSLKVEEPGSPCPHGNTQELDGCCSTCDCGKPSHANCCRFVATMLRGPLHSPALADRVLELVEENEARAKTQYVGEKK